jgi:hypothetical protein
MSAVTHTFKNAIEGQGWDMHWLRNEHWGRFWTKAIYEVRPIEPDPVTWCTPEGYYRLSPEPRDSDLGSIPPPLRGRFPHDQFPLCYIFHDEARATGRLWFSAAFDGPYERIPVAPLAADAMLYRMVRTQGGSKKRASRIYAAVAASSLYGVIRRRRRA